MAWAEIILLVLKFLNWAIQYGQEQKWLNEGERRAIARGTAEVLRRQEFANETLKEISALPDADVDALLRTLGGPEEGGGSK